MKNKNLEKYFSYYIKNNEKLFKDKKIAIGFSGGLDSCALLDLMVKNLPKNSFDIIYLTHKNSPLTPEKEIDNWLSFCTKRAKLYNMNLINIIEEVKKTKAGWEGSGHSVRKNYAFQNYDLFFVAHHLDDFCENYFIQTMRGAGTAKILKDEQTIKRPLLNFSKQDLKEYLIEKKLDWIEDFTNKDTDIARNFWRHEVLPKIEIYYPDYRKRIVTSALKEEQKNLLVKELANIDGLEDFIKNSVIKLNNKLSDIRKENLLYFYFKNKKISIENNQLKEIIKLLKKSNKKHSFQMKGQLFEVENDFINNQINLTITKAPTMKLKK